MLKRKRPRPKLNSCDRLFGRHSANVGPPAGRPDRGETRHRGRLAPRRLPFVLALAIPATRRPAEDRRGDSSSDPTLSSENPELSEACSRKLACKGAGRLECGEHRLAASFSVWQSPLRRKGNTRAGSTGLNTVTRHRRRREVMNGKHSAQAICASILFAACLVGQTVSSRHYRHRIGSGRSGGSHRGRHVDR